MEEMGVCKDIADWEQTVKPCVLFKRNCCYLVPDDVGPVSRHSSIQGKLEMGICNVTRLYFENLATKAVNNNNDNTMSGNNIYL